MIDIFRFASAVPTGLSCCNSPFVRCAVPTRNPDLLAATVLTAVSDKSGAREQSAGTSRAHYHGPIIFSCT